MSATAEKEKVVSPEKQSSVISTREAYFASLNEWVKHANMSQNAQVLFPWYLLTNYPTMFQSPGSNFPSNITPNFSANINLNQTAPTQAAAASTFNLRLLDEQAQNELISRTGGYEYVIAPFWKRLIAETIDVILLLLLKILVIFTIMNIFDMDLGIEFADSRETFQHMEDYASFVAISMDFLALSSDLLMLEIITKIIVCFNEAVWTTMYQGKTPGKAVMNLRIVYVEAIIPLQQQPAQLLQAPQMGFQNREPFRAILYPAETPGFIRAFMRALSKNVIMTLLFPMCFIMIFFKNNRTAYDIITKTVVVECDPNPVFTRQPR